VPGSVYGIFKEMFFNGTYPFDRLSDRLPPRPVVFDVGANIGLFSLALIDRIGDAVIHAFEPVPANRVFLDRNFASCLDSNASEIHVHPHAVVGPDAPSEVPIYVDPRYAETASASLDPARTPGDSNDFIMAPTTTIERVMSEHDIRRIDLLKIDCEGAEYDILPALAPEVLSHVDNVVMEAHAMGAPDRTPETLAVLLQQCGYDLEIDRGDRAWEIFATRQ